MIDEKEFQPEGFFGTRGISRTVAEARDYVRFNAVSGEAGKLDLGLALDAVFRADPNLREYEGFVEWLVRRSGGGYVMQKHPVLPSLDPIVAQVRPDHAPVTQITYHDHAGMEHPKGKGCPCGAKRHRRVQEQRAYTESERLAHEGGSAHGDHPELTTAGPHRHVEEGKYMLNPNRDRRAVSHTHRVFLLPNFEPRAMVLAALVNHEIVRRTSESIARDLDIPERSVEDTRNLARHIRRPVDHRYGGHGRSSLDGFAIGLDDRHVHQREVDFELIDTSYDHKHRNRTKPNHIGDQHRADDETGGREHTHVKMERVNLPSTEKRLDVHPWTIKRLKARDYHQVFFSIEGTPKNDALVTRGEVAFNCPSVTLWRAPELGDFAREYLQDIHVYVIPDSDWASNPAVSLQAFECREELRRLGVDVHVAAATPTCGHICGHEGQERKDHKRGVDDFLGERKEDGSPRFAPDDLIVLDRHPSETFRTWAIRYHGITSAKLYDTDVSVMRWMAIHATLTGEVKRPIGTIAKYAVKGEERAESTVYESTKRLVQARVLTTVPEGLPLDLFSKYRKTAGGRAVYLGEDFVQGLTFSIDPALRWDEEFYTIGQREADTPLQPVPGEPIGA
jgi:hypothetical protein